ncbi:MAG: hypothetical protein WCT42_00915 [Candidatus Paceibacterota bacterium]
MKEILKTSDFGTGLTELYIYESTSKTERVILLLKGIYGYHFQLDDFQTSLFGLKWDQSFIRYFLPHAHVICVNTSRLDDYNQNVFSQRRDAFEGKNYHQEVNDVEIAFNRALQLLSERGFKNLQIHLIGKSFGGTVFLGMPEIVQKSISISMFGSGCGKREDSKSSLLRTLPNEEILLKTINDYRGLFSFYHGELDEIVPIESQEKIVKASGAKLTSYITMKGVDHEFEKMYGEENLEPGTLLRKMLLNNILFSDNIKL